MLSKTGFQIIDYLVTHEEVTTKGLAAKLDKNQQYLYGVLDSLSERDILRESRGHRNQRIVSLTQHSVNEAYRDLVAELSHIQWPEILSPATVRVCWYLDEPRRIDTISDRLGISRQAVHKALSPMKGRALLDPDGPEYALSEDLMPLHDFVHELLIHEHRFQARQLAPTASIVWFDPKRVLLRVQDSEDTTALRDAEEWKLTGLACFRGSWIARFEFCR